MYAGTCPPRVHTRIYVKLFSSILTFMSRQIFMDIAVLVDAQGDMLDNIESQVLYFASPCD